MAGSRRRKSASTNKQSTGGETIAAALERYLLDLQRAPLAKRTRDAYAQHVGSYGAWLIIQQILSEPQRAGRLTNRDKKAIRRLIWAHINPPTAPFHIDMNTHLDLGPAGQDAEAA